MDSAAWPACSDDGLQSALQTQPEHKEKDGSAHGHFKHQCVSHFNMEF